MLRGVAVQGIVAGEEERGAALFGQAAIPVSYMRSCLLSPKFYNVVNRVLARIVSAPSGPLRAAVLQFLNKIMKLDRDFVPLVQNDLDLPMFLAVNLFDGDASGMQLVIDFL